MGFFKAFLSFALIVCGLTISPTYGFTSGQHCASLYNAVDFGGETFNLTEGSSFSNLEEEYVTLDSVWNVTSSLQVVPGCTVTACNDSYYDGECRDFNEGLTQLPQPFENILSVSCSCPRACKCEDVFNIRKKSCARAYLSDGGCNSCKPYYTDIKVGESDTFPEDFETKVSSLMVRPGCQLTVHDEQELQGESLSVENIVEKWTQPMRSYECSCATEDPDLPQPEPTTRPSNYPTPVDIPDSLDEISAMMNGDFGRHPGLMAALQSNRGKRSTKNAYILLLGSTGAGKSSAINMLFDNPNVTLVGPDRSITKQIHEFRIPVPVDELGIQNSELRVIDTPGLGDTQGLDKDARFLATLEEFLDGHEELKNRIPNVVMIFHKFLDNRFAGEGSQFVKMIRGLDSFRERLTDKKYSNVIFVFSHFTSETKPIARNPKRKLASLKKVIEDYSKFPRPIVLAVAENKAADQDLLMINGYYKLPNGDYYPKNLFDKITQVTQGGGDAIGDAIIRSAFRNPDSFNVSSYDFSLGEHKSSKIPKYLGILSAAVFAVNKTEISDKLTAVHENMPSELKKRFPDALYYLQKSLNLGNFRTPADLPRTTTGIVKLITELRQNEAVLYLLKKAFDISPPVLKENVLTGYSYDVFKDHPLPVSPFELGELQNSDIGYKFPAMITCVVDTQNKDILHFFKNRHEYLAERIKSLNIGGKISLESFTGAIKPGHNVLDQITSPEGNIKAPITAVRELRTFELVLNDKFTLTKEFKEAVKRLSPYNASDHVSVDLWKAFFNEYGTHVVKSVYGGGAIEIELKTEKLFSTEIGRVLMSFIQFAEDISLGKAGNSSVNHEGIQHSLKFVGGDKDHHTGDLTKMPLQEAADLLEKWKESLLLSPTILTSEMRLLPLSEITKRLGQNISSEIERATGLLFNSSLRYDPPPHSSKTIHDDRQNIQLAQTTQFFSSFMERMMEQSNKADERFQAMMLSMKEDQRRSDEQREKMYNRQLEETKAQRELEREMRKQEMETERQRQEREAEERREDALEKKRVEDTRRLADREHQNQMMSIQNAAAAQQAKLMQSMIENMPKGGGGGGCLREGTQILMADFTQKPVELLEVGEMILDHNLVPVRVSGVLEKFLLSDSFHGFDNETFFFTDTHQLVGTTTDDNLQVYVKELNKTLLENPLLAYLNVQALPEKTEILRYHTDSNTVFPEQVTVFTDLTRHSPTTSVFIILVESESGTYFANGFVCRHEIPPLQHWPHTLSVLFSLASEPEIKWIEDVPYNLKTVKMIDDIVNGGFMRLQEILKKEGGIVEGGVAAEGLSLSDQVISEIFENPTFSAFAVGIYGRLGPALAEKLEVSESIRSEMQIRRLQFVVHEGLKEYFAKALSEAF